MPKKILVVDDDEEDLDAIRTVLEKEKYIVATAESGQQALDLLDSARFDLFLIDVKMPELSGNELLELIKKKINYHAKMVFISIVPEKEVYTDGAEGFIQKPFNPRDLLEKVRGVLKG